MKRALVVFVMFFLASVVTLAQGPVDHVDYSEMRVSDLQSGTLVVVENVVPEGIIITADDSFTVLTGTVKAVVPAGGISPEDWGDDPGWSSIFARSLVEPVEGIVAFTVYNDGGYCGADWHSLPSFATATPIEAPTATATATAAPASPTATAAPASPTATAAPASPTATAAAATAAATAKPASVTVTAVPSKLTLPILRERFFNLPGFWQIVFIVVAFVIAVLFLLIVIWAVHNLVGLLRKRSK